MIRKIWDFILDTTQTITVSMAIFVMVYLFLGRPTQVLGYSMEPSLDNNDRLIVESVSPHLGNLERGDIVVVHSPVVQDMDYVKRIVGVPGDELTIKDCNVIVKNNENPSGYVLEENYLIPNTCTRGGIKIEEGKTVFIPGNYYLVMGDNREHSFDGRFFGLLPKSAISGKALLRWWPADKWKIFN